MAADVAQSAGISTVEGRTSASMAQLYLEAALQGKNPLPNVILLDLDLGYESGHELLRFWHRNLKASGVRLVVWTILGEEQQHLCRLFGASAVVPKWKGAGALRRALEPLAA